MKKIVFLFVLCILCGCSSDDIEKEAFLKLQIAKIPDNVSDIYSFTDIHITIYTDKNDYLNETNPFYSGKFDTQGKVTISNGIERGKIYYIDIYTNDNYLSNWKYVDFDTTTTDGNILISGFTEDDYSGFDGFSKIYLNEKSKMLIGTWNFIGYGHHNHSDHDRTERTKLVIGKDFSITSYEKYATTDYTVQYTYGINNGVGYIGTTPSDDGYPYFGITNESGGLRNPDGIFLQFNPETDKIIKFWDYADEEALYTK